MLTGVCDHYRESLTLYHRAIEILDGATNEDEFTKGVNMCRSASKFLCVPLNSYFLHSSANYLITYRGTTPE